MTSRCCQHDSWPLAQRPVHVFLLDLLCFEFDRDGDKAPPFQEVFSSLGVEFDLTDSSEQVFFFRIQNAAERTKSLIEDLAVFQEQGASSPKTWNRLRGRLHFVAGQLSLGACRRAS